MAEKPTNDVLRARAEAAELLGFGDNPDRLCASDRLKVDLVCSLRAAIDHAAQSLVDGDGGSADLGRLIGATESLIKFLPKTVEPVSHRADPRRALFELIMQQRERAGIPDEGTTQATINAQATEIAQLRAQLAGKTPEDSDVPTVVERVPAPAPAAKVVPLPRAAAPGPAAKASPSYDYDRERGWRDHVQPDGSISPTPFGGGRKWWGPVNAAR